MLRIVVIVNIEGALVGTKRVQQFASLSVWGQR